ncbi:hypothetical protein [Sphingobacterium siyangense]|uniref:hypothetical protein n=1 Tax=Sphingobacterium siyangense TaxID=459529 RepID=UPI003DA6254A
MKNPILQPLRWCALFSFLFSFTTYAQNNKTTSPQQKSADNQTDVYIAGSWYDKNTGQILAAYFKNGEPVVLKEGQDPGIFAVRSLAKSIFVEGNNIHVVGNTLNASNKEIAAYWKNQKFQPLSIKKDKYGNIENSSATGIEVSNGNVFIFPYQPATVKDYYYLKNGQEMNFPNQVQSGVINDRVHFVSGNDVYLAHATDEAAYWKNGVKVSLNNTMHHPDGVQVSSIFVSGDDVYVSGYKSYASKGADNTNRQMALYWKNGQEVILSTGSGRFGTRSTSSIFVSGNDVYVSGMSQDPNTGESIAIYWKNGQEVVLAKGPTFTQTFAIAVAGNDVYVAGENANRKVYWKNGQEINLPNCSDLSSMMLAKGDGNGNKVVFSNVENNNPNVPQIIEPKNYTVMDQFPRTTKIAWTAVANATEYEVIVEYAAMSTNGDRSFKDAVKFYPYLSGKTKAKAVTFDGVGAQVHRYKVQALNKDKIISATDWFYINYLH